MAMADLSDTGNGFRLLMGQIMANQGEQSRQLAAATERLTRLEERMDTLIKTISAYDMRVAALNGKIDTVVQMEERVGALEKRAEEEDTSADEVEKEALKNRTLVITALIGGFFALLTTIVNVVSGIVNK